jgi:hypothetical protein
MNKKGYPHIYTWPKITGRKRIERTEKASKGFHLINWKQKYEQFQRRLESIALKNRWILYAPV